MNFPTAKSRQEQALEFLDAIRAELEENNLDDAANELKKLDELITDWQRSEHVQTARTWLDTALEEDLLAFDAATARDYLQKWADAALETASLELDDYRKRVENRVQAKQETLLVRGVMSHCEELLTQAQTLESSLEAPAPDFMMRQYYSKARLIVRAAQTEHEKNTDLERMVQRVERLFQNKESATAVYTMALESQKFSNALHNLEQLPTEFLVPRFTALESATGDKKLSYQGMVKLPQAREEITQQAKTWAATTADKAMKTAAQYLEAHEPSEAVEELDLGENVEKFLSLEDKERLQAAKTQATTQLRNREKAEERATRALEIMTEDPLKAWEEYTGAVAVYQWIEGLEEVKEAVLKNMRARLKGLAREADSAFHEARDMVRVRQISQRAKSTYASKDPSLNEILVQFDEFEDMVQRYEDYLRSGTEILEKVNTLIWEDAVAANDFLTQVESYPEFVLQDFPTLYDLRVQVNQRLNADQTYNQLYTSLFNETIPDITQAIERTKVAGEDFPDDERFNILVQWLQFHMAFLSAQQQAERGSAEQALALLAPVLNVPKHPDHETALKIKKELDAKKAAEIADEDEDEV